MKPEVEKRLEAILDNREKKREAVARQATERERAEEKNLADYLATKDRVIKPALQEIADIYKRRGIPIPIVDEPEEPMEKGRIKPPTIALDLSEAFPGHSRDMRPRFQLTFNKEKRTLWTHETTTWSSGSGDEVALDSINADWIHNAFVKYESKA